MMVSGHDDDDDAAQDDDDDNDDVRGAQPPGLGDVVGLRAWIQVLPLRE